MEQNPKNQVQVFPVADGGEGTTEVFSKILDAKMHEANTVDAYGKEIVAKFAYSEDKRIAIIDVASCIGLNMVPKEKRNPYLASSRGVGILLRHVCRLKPQTIIIGLGGSSTNDGGMGLLYEFGVRFYDSQRRLLKPNVYSLPQIAFVDKRNFFWNKNIELIVACDVKNPLLGPEGATFTFGRQKGLFGNQLEQVDGWMSHYRDKLRQTFHVDINLFEGAGAAGGIGAALLGLFGAKMVPGIDLVVEYAKMEQAISKCDYVITGEGQTDYQTLYGKVPFGILQVARKYNKPVIVLSGALGRGYQQFYMDGVIGIFSSSDRSMTFSTALKTSPEKLKALAYGISRLIEGVKSGGKL